LATPGRSLNGARRSLQATSQSGGECGGGSARIEKKEGAAAHLKRWAGTYL
jgi:hypothetical protein